MIPDGVMVLSSQAVKSSILELLHANMIRTIVMGLLITKKSAYHIIVLISYEMFSSERLCEVKTLTILTLSQHQQACYASAS